MPLDHKMHGIMTTAGKRIYDMAMHQIDSLHKRLIDPKMHRDERDRIHQKISRIESKAIKEATAVKRSKRSKLQSAACVDELRLALPLIGYQWNLFF